MSDQRLRDLERRALAGDDGAAVAWAGALDRLDRPDDAVDALLRTRDDVLARRELATRVASWAHGHARPILAQPRVRWRSASPGGARLTAGGVLVVGLRARELLDLETGQVRARFFGRGPVCTHAELLVVAHRTEWVVLDGWTGQTVFWRQRPSGFDAVGIGGLLVRAGPRGEVIAERQDDLRRPLWRLAWRLEARDGPGPDARIGAGDDHVVVWTDPRARLTAWAQSLDLDGDVRWRRRRRHVVPWSIDVLDDGEALVDGTLVDREGRARWHRDGLRPLAWGPTCVVARLPDAGAWAVLDRATGAVQYREDGPCSAAAVLRDVVVVADGFGLTALGPRGEPVWTLADPHLGSSRQLLAGPGLLVAVTPSGVVCVS